MSASAAIESAMHGWESQYNVPYNDCHASALTSTAAGMPFLVVCATALTCLLILSLSSISAKAHTTIAKSGF
jgi:hypothetical protein